MPLTFEIIAGVGVFTSKGDVVFEEGLKVMTSGLETLVGQDIELILIDTRLSTEERTPDEARGIGTVVRQYIPRGRLAVVVANDYFYAISRVFAAFAEHGDLQVAVFRELEAAGEWLAGDLEAGDLE